MDGRISTYGFSLNVISRNSRIQQQMAQVQEQIATGVKSQRLSGYGVDNLRLQNARIGVSSINSYIFNIEAAASRIKQMNLGISELTEQSDIVLGAISILPQEGDIDINNLKNLAETAKNIVEDILNQDIGGNYIFAGSDIKNKPLDNMGTLVTRVQAQMTSWLDGTNDADTFLTNINGYTDSQSGFSMGVQNSSTVRVRADDSFEVDYTVRANAEGFKDILVGLVALSELEFPDPDVDLASREQFFEIVNGLYSKVQGGVEKVRADEIKLAAADGAIGRKLAQHKTDKGFLQTTIEDIQAIDPAEAVVRFQALQTNLEAAFQATSIISSLSLARLL